MTSTFKHSAIKTQRSDGAKEKTWVSFRLNRNELYKESVTTESQGHESAAAQDFRRQNEMTNQASHLTTMRFQGNISVV